LQKGVIDIANKKNNSNLLEIKDIAMSTTWRIRFDDQRTEVLESGPRAYHFFTQSPSIVAEQREQYGEAVLDFHETSPFFDYLDFTSQDVAELLEVDPSTLFRWKKDDRKLSKAITKNLLEMDQIIAKDLLTSSRIPIRLPWWIRLWRRFLGVISSNALLQTNRAPSRP
jgi:hypothetical protein